MRTILIAFALLFSAFSYTPSAHAARVLKYRTSGRIEISHWDGSSSTTEISPILKVTLLSARTVKVTVDLLGTRHSKNLKLKGPRFKRSLFHVPFAAIFPELNSCEGGVYETLEQRHFALLSIVSCKDQIGATVEQTRVFVYLEIGRQIS